MRQSFKKISQGLFLPLITGFLLASLALGIGWQLIEPNGAAWERAWILGFHHVPRMVHNVLAFVTVVGYPIEIITCLVVVTLWWSLRGAGWKTALLFGDTIFLTIIDYGAKPFFRRPRPELFPHAYLPSFSYPSGHALFLSGFYGAIAYLIATSVNRTTARVIWMAWLFFALLIGFSRISLGVHWPTDIFAGYLAGGIMLAATVVARRRAFPQSH